MGGRERETDEIHKGWEEKTGALPDCSLCQEDYP